MKNCMLTFRSVTPAQRAEEVLQRAGVACSVHRTPKYMEEKGCGYSVRLGCEDVTGAVILLREKNIAFRKVYTMNDGVAKELRI